MTQNDDSLRFEGTQPMRYRILVAGKVNSRCSERFAGLEIAPIEETSSMAAVTKLEGPIQDQTELLAVLNTLYELHLSLISVEALEEVCAKND